MMAEETIKLNLGSGDKPLDGYVNLDAKKGHEVYPLWHHYLLADEVVFSIPDEGVDEIRASHVLEHFPHNETQKVLADWVTHLKPGGVLKIAVPDFTQIAKAYLEGHAMAAEGYIMGGQSDEYDYHKALFDEPGLRKMMAEAGLTDIQPWQSEIADCASLAISLNLMGTKPDKPSQISDLKSQIKVRVAAVMSVPRLSITNNVACMFRTIAECGIPCRPGQGVFWHHALTRQIEDRIAEGFNILLAVDFDTWFLPAHVARLIELLTQTPEADAICAVQCEREGSLPIMGMRDERGEPLRVIPRKLFEQALTPIQVGHFGLTIFRAACFARIPKPWFRDEPDSNGSWREGRQDADVAFWAKFNQAGCKLFMANEVNVGHLQEICTFSGPASDNWRSVHVYLKDLNSGRIPDHCRADYRLI